MLAQGRKRNPSLSEMREGEGRRLLKAPKDVEIFEDTVGGCTGEWHRPKETNPSAILLYLHGGAYVTGSHRTHRALAANLARAVRCLTFVCDYRLAPEHPFPAALEDAASVFRALQLRFPNAFIAVAGDSAGGGLSLSLAIHLRDEGISLPCALALLSPWTDLTLNNETHKTKTDVDPFFTTADALKFAVTAYAGTNAVTVPLISPQFADLHGLPPTIIHVGDLETLLDDSRVIAKKLQAAGVEVSFKIFPRMWHVWQAFAGCFREADESIVEIGTFLRSHINY